MVETEFDDFVPDAGRVEAIRSHFPALERIHNDNPVAYFDGPGGTQVPREVVDSMADYLFHHNANTHWAYPASEETDMAITYGRQAVAEFLNARPNEIVFGANMTNLTFHVSRALGFRFAPGDEIVVTDLDHHANIAPWQVLARERGLVIRRVTFQTGTGQLDPDDLQNKITGKTRLLAIGAASNCLGTINDVLSATRMAHSVGALVFVDAVHSAPHNLTDVVSLECDFLCCSAYKFYGPHIGVLFCKQDLLETLDFPKLIPAPNTPPERAETGTQNHEGIAGTAAAIDFLANLASPGRPRRKMLRDMFAAMHHRGAILIKQLWEELSVLNNVTLFGPPPREPRTPTLSFKIKDKDSSEVARSLAAGIFVSHGDFYAATIVERLGLPSSGLVRAGCACYTTSSEVERLIAAVGRIARAA